MLRLLAVFAFSFTLYQNAHGLFTSTPSDVTPQKTPDVTLKCEPMGVEGLILAIHIKKKDELPLETKGIGDETEDDDEKEGGEEQNDNDRYKRSLDRYKRESSEYRQNRRYKRDAYDQGDDDFVRATMTTGSNIDVVPKIERFEVEGNINSDPYLSVKISNPDVSDLGLFECQVTFFDSTGSIQVTSETTTINEAMALSLDSLEERVSKLEGQLPLVLAIGNVLEKTVQEVKDNDRMMQEDVAALKKENKQLVETIADLSSNLRSLNAKFAAVTGQSGYSENKGSYESEDSRNYNQQSYNAESDYKSGLRSDELFKVNARMDELENTRIHVLEQQMDEVKERQVGVQNRMDDIEMTVNESMDERIRALERLDWKGISESLEEIEMETIPVLIKNVSSFDKQITMVLKGLSMVMSPQDVMKLMQSMQNSSSASIGNMMGQSMGASGSYDTTEYQVDAVGSSDTYQEEEEDTTTAAATTTEPGEETTSTAIATTTTTEIATTAEAITTTETMTTATTTTTTTPTTESTTPTPTTVATTTLNPDAYSCYVCGNNATQEPCTSVTSKNVEACPDGRSYCITDVYQDGRWRQIYRRCATINECQNAVRDSESRCATDNFLTQTAMECHFCCSSSLCNEYLRPDRDLYHM